MKITWIKEDVPRFMVFSKIESEQRYTYFISKAQETEGFLLSIVKFGNAKEVPAYTQIHNTVEEAELHAEWHYKEYLLNDKTIF